MLATQGTQNMPPPPAPLQPARLSLPAQRSHQQFWRELAGIFVAWMAVPVLLEPAEELAWSSWGKSHLSPSADSIPSASSPRLWELVLGEAGEWWGQAWLCALPPPHLRSSWRKPAKLSRKESLFRILTFSGVSRPTEAQL